MSHAAALHEQQTDARRGLLAAKGCPCDPRRLADLRRDRRGIGLGNAQRHWLLQGALAERAVVSRALLARRLGGHVGRDVRSGPSEGDTQTWRMEATGHLDARDQGSRIRLASRAERAGAIDRIPANVMTLAKIVHTLVRSDPPSRPRTCARRRPPVS